VCKACHGDGQLLTAVRGNKAQEKRARKAAKQAMQNQTVNSDSRAVAKLVNAGYPGGLRCPKQR
jgi:hypothetical protein